jgi:ADP-dependent NAD(P)H-hydrate dehydratase / NAD(P)H-hydrate epimerase
MKILTGNQIHELDTYTIDKEPITSIDLMERASLAIATAITEEWGAHVPVVVFAGSGNNGGDALAVARLLIERGYHVETFLFNTRHNLSDGCSTNKERLAAVSTADLFHEITADFTPPRLSADTVVVDGLFGSGLNRPLSGGYAALVRYINQSGSRVVSIDMPSGLLAEDNTANDTNNIIRATLTLTLQHRKLCMLFADAQPFLGRVKVLDIGLSQTYVEHTECRYEVVESDSVRQLMQPRNDFAHKGTMGHAMLVAGARGMAGAAMLAARACLRSGVGKLTAATPQCNYAIMQQSVPEAIVALDGDDSFDSELPTDGISALGIGPGLGTAEHSALAMMNLIQQAQCPLVLDADALNMLSTHGVWTEQLPLGIVLTPHPREFDRLYGETCHGDYHRLQSASQMAADLQAYIILKGHHSAICLPDGKVLFNATGNAGMATAGSGDVLTGILTALLARGYSQHDACIVGVWLHGLAGDLAAEHLGRESLVASDLIRFLPEAFKSLGCI